MDIDKGTTTELKQFACTIISNFGRRKFSNSVELAIILACCQVLLAYRCISFFKHNYYYYFTEALNKIMQNVLELGVSRM